MIEVGQVQCETFLFRAHTCNEDCHMANNDKGSQPCSDIMVMRSHSKFCILAVPAKRKRPRTAAIQDTEELLHLVCAKLVSVQRERYNRLQKTLTFCYCYYVFVTNRNATITHSYD